MGEPSICSQQQCPLLALLATDLKRLIVHYPLSPLNKVVHTRRIKAILEQYPPPKVINPSRDEEHSQQSKKRKSKTLKKHQNHELDFERKLLHTSWLRVKSLIRGIPCLLFVWPYWIPDFYPL